MNRILEDKFYKENKKYMKKTIVFLTLFVLSLLFQLCKKGENDPDFTLLSRKQRVEGNWKMKEANITIGVKDSTGAYSALKYKLKETSYILDFVGSGAHFEEKCNLTISFTKTGTAIIKQTMDSLSVEFMGFWDFEGKVGKNKNKERISIRLEELNNYSNRFRLFNKSQTQFTYRIKELRDKKMVLVSEEEMIVIDSSAGIYITSEYTFVQ